jgi:C-terminal processing protease CtpA/Prc
MLRGFRRREDGQMGLAEAEGKLQEGDRVVRLNGEDVESMAFHTLVSRIRGCT